MTFERTAPFTSGLLALLRAPQLELLSLSVSGRPNGVRPFRRLNHLHFHNSADISGRCVPTHRPLVTGTGSDVQVSSPRRRPVLRTGTLTPVVAAPATRTPKPTYRVGNYFYSRGRFDYRGRTSLHKPTFLPIALCGAVEVTACVRFDPSLSAENEPASDGGVGSADRSANHRVPSRRSAVRVALTQRFRHVCVRAGGFGGDEVKHYCPMSTMPNSRQGPRNPSSLGRPVRHRRNTAHDAGRARRR